MSTRRSLCLGGITLFALETAALPLSGNVALDFSRPETVSMSEVQDVGLPATAPSGTVSGWDIAGISFHLDLLADELSVGLRFHGLAGDADGNGDASGTAPWLAAMNGQDLAGLTGMEAICVLFDFNRDGTWDLVAGNRMLGDPLLNGYYQSLITEPVGSLPLAFNLADAPITGSHFYDPNPATPDYELTVRSASALFELVGNSTCFDFVAFAGSFADAGVGEDHITGSVCLVDGGRPAAPAVHIQRLAGGALRLGWPAVAGASSYKVQHALHPEGPWSTVAQGVNPAWQRPPVGATEPVGFYRVLAVH